MNDPARIPSNSAQVLAKLAAQRHWTQSRIVATSAEFGAEGALSKDLFALARRAGATLSLRHHDRLARVFNLTTDASYRIFGRQLDDIARFEEELNPNRTRLIESYVYHRDHPIQVPRTYSSDTPRDRSYFISDVVTEWQHLPIRSLGNRSTSPPSFVYAKLGLSDETASAAIPRGAYVQGFPLDEHENLRPDPSKYYLIQHGHGYLCSRCIVEGEFLHLIVDGAGYQGRRRLRLAQDAQILARAGAYFASLLLPPIIYSVSVAQHPAAPIIPPWSQTSLQQLIATERLRFGLSAAHIDQRSRRLPAWAGYKVSGKHVPVIETAEGLPHVSTAFCLAAICSLRLQDVLRSCRVELDDARRLSLETILQANNQQDIDRYLNHLAEQEQSRTNVWPPSLSRWSDLGTLLSIIRRHFPEPQFEFLHVDQGIQYRGLDPRIRSGSILVVQLFSSRNQVREPLNSEYQRKGRRLIYVIRHKGSLICSYIEATGNDHLILVPHPLAKGGSPRVITRKDTTLIGIGVGELVLL
jgi:hypothetical protein